MDNKKEQLCPNCLTGKEALQLDPKEPLCPYLYLYKDGECGRFKTIPGGDER